jgi:hypothetical protein
MACRRPVDASPARAGALVRVLRAGGWLAMLPALALAADPAPEDGAWVEVGRQGITRTIVVPLAQAADRAAYGRQIERLCPGTSSCFLNFYSNSKGVPLSDPLPDAVFQEPTAVYRKSPKQGAELLRFSCRLGLDPATCF